MNSPNAKTLIVVGDTRFAKCRSVLQKMRRIHGSIAVVRISTEVFPVWEEGYELFFLTMGRSAMDDVAIAQKYDCSEDELYSAFWDDLAPSYRLKVGSVVGIVFPFDLGWVPEDMAELFMSHLPKDVALQSIYPIRREKILQPDSAEYNGVYRIFPDCPETTLEI
jgi:hypothetical protein